VLRYIGERQSRFPGQLLDGSFGLAQEFQQFKARPAGQRFADTGELLEKFALESVLSFQFHLFNRLVE
jgi:hypothetical protein